MWGEGEGNQTITLRGSWLALGEGPVSTAAASAPPSAPSSRLLLLLHPLGKVLREEALLGASAAR